ncbi:amino acid/polyamine transporter I [Apiospora arundinis]|uniref:Amino acid/polyamine transporter I n=1 Tax=Apiospora arundinis TaxID=335852 RepID=A0ABR2IVZ0_9PEZI
MALDSKFTDTKADPATVDIELDDSLDPRDGNARDRRDMTRMGKAQELKRNFKFLSIFGFSMILMQAWESVLAIGSIGLTNGGTAGYIWMFLICWIGFGFVNTSMAEMGSMAPTTGGQYHWVSEFAPRKHQKFLSYVMGWMCVLSWQTGCASSAYISGGQIQGLIALNYESYQPQGWHTTMLAIAVAAFSVFFNAALARKLPLVEAGLLTIHVLGFVAIMVVLWVLAPRTPASEVFTTFNDGNHWGSMGLSVMIGSMASVYPLLGADAAVHMSEELQDAARTLPRSMIWTTFFNGAFGWIMLITFCSCLGKVEDVLNTPTGIPFLAVFENATQTKGGATAMSVIIVIMTIAGNLTGVATASRQLWSFSRDQGMPFSSYFAYVHPGLNLPINSITMTLVVTVLLTLIAIGSDVALNSLTSLGTNAILSSYICSIGCITWRRLTNQPLLPSKLSLGRWGLTINIISMVFLILIFFFAFFPPGPNPAPADMNWNILIYGVSVVGSLLYYAFSAKKRYVGPVEYVRKLD